MARFRKMRRKASRAFRRFGRKMRRSSSKSGGLMNTIIAGAIYGAARGPVATLATPLSSKMPFGNYNDEVTMAAASFAAMKFGSGMLREVGKMGLVIEVASLASQMTTGMVNTTQTTSSSTSW